MKSLFSTQFGHWFGHSFGHPASNHLIRGVFADSVNDATSTRNVYLLALGLVALGGLLLAITIWFWRTTRPEPELLAPLETMGDRKFRESDGRTQREMLDAVRPAGAQPMSWGVVHGEPIVDAEIDLEAAARADLNGYDDLRDPEDAPDLGEPDAVVPDLAGASVAAMAAESVREDESLPEDESPPTDEPLPEDESARSDEPLPEDAAMDEPAGDSPIDPLLRISDRNAQ